MGNLVGPLKDIVPMFQKYKKSIGYKYDSIETYKVIDKILYDNNIKHLKNTKKIYAILVTNENNEKKKKKNYKALKELYDYINIVNPNNEIYFEGEFFKSKKRKLRTILTDQEIIKLFNIVDNESKMYDDELRYIYPVLMRLLYSCGLRISEALNLKIADFDGKNNTILVKKSKYNITRLLALSDSMSETMAQYFKHTKQNSKYLFEYKNKRLIYRTVWDFFKKVRELLEKNDLTLHDLRFTFCVHTINNNFDNKITFKEILYPLSLYMGHQNIQSTEYYHILTKEYYKNIVAKSKVTSKKIFPNLEVKTND